MSFIGTYIVTIIWPNKQEMCKIYFTVLYATQDVTKKIEFEKEVSIEIKSKETSSYTQLQRAS